MNRLFFLFLLCLQAFTFLACEDEVELYDSYLENNGVIVSGVDRVWFTPFDSVPAVKAYMNPYCVQFDNKVLLGGKRNGSSSLFCMNMETGDTLWSMPLTQSEYGATIHVVKYIESERTLVFFYTEDIFENDKIHVKIYVDNGKVIWRKTRTHKGYPYAASDSCYYYTQYYPLDGLDVQATYKVSIATGDEELFYVTDLEPAEGYQDYATNSYGDPFVYRGKEYVFMTESRYDGAQGDFFISLVDASTGDVLLKQIATHVYDTPQRVDVFNDRIYVFTQRGYRIFDMDQLSFTKYVQAVNSACFGSHHFYDGKLILTMSYLFTDPGYPSPTDDKSIFVYDLNTDSLIFSIEGHNSFFAPVLDGYLYIRAGHYLKAWDINTGIQRLYLKPKSEGGDLGFDICAYQNADGEKFVICSNNRGIYCIKGL